MPKKLSLLAVKYDLLNDLEPVSLLPSSRLWIVARMGLAANDLSELIVQLTASPDTLSAALPGLGSAGHVAAVDFQNRTGTRFQLVPYRLRRFQQRSGDAGLDSRSC